MKESSKDKMHAADVLDMVHLEKLVKRLGMGISDGFMDDLTEIFSRARNLNESQAWGFFNHTMQIVSDITSKKLAEKIEFRYLTHTDGETAYGLKEWAENAAFYFMGGMDDVRPMADTLDATIIEQVYKETEELLGFNE